MSSAKDDPVALEVSFSAFFVLRCWGFLRVLPSSRALALLLTRRRAITPQATIDAARHRGDFDEAVKLVKVYTKVTSSSGSGGGRLTPAHPTAEAAAAFAFSVQAEAWLRSGRQRSSRKARKFLRKALALVPQYADALALKAEVELAPAEVTSREEGRGVRRRVGRYLKAGRDRLALKGKSGGGPGKDVPATSVDDGEGGGPGSSGAGKDGGSSPRSLRPSAAGDPPGSDDGGGGGGGADAVVADAAGSVDDSGTDESESDGEEDIATFRSLLDAPAQLRSVRVPTHRTVVLLRGLWQLCHYYDAHGRLESACVACEGMWRLGLGAGASPKEQSLPEGFGRSSDATVRELVVESVQAYARLLLRRRLFSDGVLAYRTCLRLDGPISKHLTPVQRRSLLVELGRVLSRAVGPSEYPQWDDSAVRGDTTPPPASAREEGALALALAASLPPAAPVQAASAAGPDSGGRAAGGAAAAVSGSSASGGASGGAGGAAPEVPPPGRAVNEADDTVVSTAVAELLALEAHCGTKQEAVLLMEDRISRVPGTVLEWARLGLALSRCGPDKGRAALHAIEQALQLRREQMAMRARLAEENQTLNDQIAIANKLVPNYFLLLLASRVSLFSSNRPALAVRYAQAAVASATEAAPTVETAAARAGSAGPAARCWAALGIAFAVWSRSSPTDARRQERRRHARAALLRACDAYWERARQLDAKYGGVRTPKQPHVAGDTGWASGTSDGWQSDPDAAAAAAMAAATATAEDDEDGDAAVQSADAAPGDLGDAVPVVPPTKRAVSSTTTLTVEFGEVGAFADAESDGEAPQRGPGSANPDIPSDWRLCFNTALVLAESREFTSAMPYAIQALTLRPSSPEVWRLVALLTSVIKGMPAALKVVNAGLMQHASNRSLLFVKARLYEMEHDDAALAAYAELSSTLSGDGDASVAAASPSSYGARRAPPGSAPGSSDVPAENVMQAYSDSRVHSVRDADAAEEVAIWCAHSLAHAEAGNVHEARTCLVLADRAAERAGDPQNRAAVIHQAAMLHEMTGAGAAAEAQYAAAVAVDPFHAPSLVRLSAIALRSAASSDGTGAGSLDHAGAGIGMAGPGVQSSGGLAGGGTGADAAIAAGLSPALKDRDAVLDRSYTWAVRALRADASSPHAWHILGGIEAARGEPERAAHSILTALELESCTPVCPFDSIPFQY